MIPIFHRKSRAATLGAMSALILVAAGAVRPAAAQSAQIAPAPGAAAPAEQLPERFADNVEIRIALLHQELEIRPGQEALFRAYADTMRANAQAIFMLFLERRATVDFSAPATLRWLAQLSAARAEALNRLAGPFGALYQSLSPAQKTLADRHFEQFRQRLMPRRAR
jgi:periplasmic protein CpxP/Spy